MVGVGSLLDLDRVLDPVEVGLDPDCGHDLGVPELGVPKFKRSVDDNRWHFY